MSQRLSRRITDIVSLVRQQSVYVPLERVESGKDGSRERVPLVDRAVVNSEGQGESAILSTEPSLVSDDSSAAAVTLREPKCKKCRAFLAQYLASTAKNLIAFDISLSTGFLDRLPKEIKNTDDGLEMDGNLKSWFEFIMVICLPIGSLFSGVVVDYFGRKRSLMAVNIPLAIAWLLLYFAINPVMLFTSAILTGFCIGLHEAAAEAYSGEICQPNYRGTISASVGILSFVGLIIALILMHIFPWRIAALISAGLPVISFICTALIPDSPQWLVSRGRIKDAEKSLCWLRGWIHRDFVQHELKQLLSYNEKIRNSNYMVVIPPEEMKSDPNSKELLSPNDRVKRFTFIHLMRGLGELCTRRALVLVFMCMFLRVTAGAMVIDIYVDYASSTLQLPLSPKLIRLISAINGILATFMMMFLISKVGKRFLMLFSLVIVFVCNILCATYQLLNLGKLLAVSTLIPLILLEIDIFCTNISLTPIPGILACEVFSFNTRCISIGICTASGQLMNLAASKAYLPFANATDLHGVFWFQAACSILGFCYVFYYLPETEARSLEEIEEFFREGQRPNAQQKSTLKNSALGPR